MEEKEKQLNEFFSTLIDLSLENKVEKMSDEEIDTNLKDIENRNLNDAIRKKGKNILNMEKLKRKWKYQKKKENH